MAKYAIAGREDRLEEWKVWLENFPDILEDNEKKHLELIPRAAELLNDYYWRLAKQFIRPLLQDQNSPEEHNIHYYKIISASELTTMAVLPWKYAEGHSHAHDQRCHINARFGMFVAIAIMLNWKIDGKEVVREEELAEVMNHVEQINVLDGKAIAYPYNFRDEHIALLQYLNISGPLPVLINSQTWRLCYHACIAIRNKGKL